jgi:hypothetical protein
MTTWAACSTTARATTGAIDHGGARRQSSVKSLMM